MDRQTQSKRKIAFISQPWNDVSPTREAGSIVVWTGNVARQLAHTCDVTVFAPLHPGQREHETHEGVHYHRINMKHDRRLLKLARHAFRFEDPHRPLVASRIYFPTYAMQIARHLRKEHFDTVHIHNLTQYVPIVHLICPNIQIALHMHCLWLTQQHRPTMTHRVQRADIILGCSQEIVTLARQAFPDAASRCHSLLNGVDTNRFAPSDRPNEPHTLLFVGRVSPEKGLHVLLDAMPRILQEFPDTVLHIVGLRSVCPPEYIVSVSHDPKVKALQRFYEGTDYQEYIDSQVKRLPGSSVIWHNVVPQRQLLEYFHRASVLTMPSLSEALPMTVLEAMSTATPVVASDVGGISQVVRHENTGLLVDSDESEELAQSVVRVMKDQALASRLGDNAREFILNNCAWERVAARLLDIYLQPEAVQTQPLQA